MTRPVTRVVLRPLATPLPVGFLALVLATVAFSAVQLGWVPPDQGRIAAPAALAATLPLQFLSSVMGFFARDPVAAIGRGVLAGTWAVVGLATYTSPPGTASKGLGVVLVTAGLAMLVPAVAAASSKVLPAAVMGLASARFLLTGIYEMTGSATWKTTAGWVGIVLAAVALYAALALELEGAQQETVLPVGRRGAGRSAVDGDGAPDGRRIEREAGVRPQL